jgi:hypothetical protein
VAQVKVNGPDGNTYHFPEGTTKEKAIAYFKKKGIGVKSPGNSPKIDTLLASRKAASASEAEQNRPEFEKPAPLFSGAGIKAALSAPLDVAIGAERALGLDPMHPVASAPAAIEGIGTGFYNSLAHPINTIKGLATSFGSAAGREAQALRQGNLPAAAQSAGEGAVAFTGLAEGTRAAWNAADIIPMPRANGTPLSVGQLRRALSKYGVPEALEERAAANRVPMKGPGFNRIGSIYAMGRLAGQPEIAEGLIAADFARRWQPYRNAKARAMEFAAKHFDDPNAEPPAPRETNITRGPEHSVAFPSEEPPPVREVAVEPRTEHQIKFPNEEPPPVRETPKTEQVEHEIQGQLSSGGTVTPNYASLEQKIAPSGDIAKRAVQAVDEFGKPTPFARDLVRLVPELVDASKGADADAAMMQGYRRVLQGLNEAEDRVPEGTTVDVIPIESGLHQMAIDYAKQGLHTLAQKMEDLAQEWGTGSGKRSWGDFLNKKRAFFKNNNLRSSPMRQAYNLLMQATARVAPELSEANANYSTLRRALDNANIDVNTGRRISKVGKEPKGTTAMSERGTQQRKIENRQQALDRLKPFLPEE